MALAPALPRVDFWCAPSRFERLRVRQHHQVRVSCEAVCKPAHRRLTVDLVAYDIE